MAALVVAILSFPAIADAKAGCNTYECTVRVLSKQCSNDRPRTCVEWIIRRHKITGWQAAWLRRIPGCESQWDPRAWNPTPVGPRREHASGLYQFLPSTWTTTPHGKLVRKRGAGKWIWAPKHSIWSARWQSAAARWMVTHGRAREWVCR